MEVLVEQGCPQCNGEIVLKESDRLLDCSYCGVKNLVLPQGRNVFRYVLPPQVTQEVGTNFLMVPYFRFKGTIFQVTGDGIIHKAVDTTQVAASVEGIAPSLGVRSQAMRLRRVLPAIQARYLSGSRKPSAVLMKAAHVSGMGVAREDGLVHRAFIGETVSIIYLPLLKVHNRYIDSVSRSEIPSAFPGGEKSGNPKITSFNPAWSVRYLATLCPHCGWNLDANPDGVVLHCSNCNKAWEISGSRLKEVNWAADRKGSGLLLPFWRLSGAIPALKIFSFRDLIKRTGLHFPVTDSVANRGLSFLVPGFKIRPKWFLMAARRATLGQHNLLLGSGTRDCRYHPVTLPSSEARQVVKVLLASATVKRKELYPKLPLAQLADPLVELVYINFEDKGHDVSSPDLGFAIGKRLLEFGRSM